MNREIEELTDRIREFNRERDWEQFHSAKNLSISLVIEAAELAEVFQWLSAEESDRLPPEALKRADEEIGDVLLYLLNLADRLGIDPLDAARRKLELNGQKYPVEKARSSSRKYTELE